MRKLLILLLLLINNNIFAQNFNSPIPQPGFTHEKFSVDTDDAHGLIVDAGFLNKVSPTIAEVDGNTANGLEIVFVSSDAILFVYKSDGSLLWSRKLKISNCSLGNAKDRAYSSPAVGDLYGTGEPHVVVGYGGFSVASRRCGGGVTAFNGADGTQKWNFNLKKFDRRKGLGGLGPSVFGSVSLADTDGDGKMEVGFGAFVHYVFLLEFNGKVRYYYNAADTVWSTPSFYDVNNDGRLEMLIGTDISKNPYLKPRTRDGGFLYALSTEKFANKERGFRDKETVVWKKFFNQTIMSSPVIADVIPDNGAMEVVVQSGCYFPDNSSNKRGKWIKVLNVRNGKVLKTLKTEACSPSTVAVADIDYDGQLEIVALVHGNKSIGGPGASKIVAFKATQSEPIWTRVPKVNGKNDSYGAHFQSPVIADVDGNGSLEVLVANSRGVGIYNARNGEPLTCEKRNCFDDENSDQSLYTWSLIKNTVAVADIDLDGDLEVVAGARHKKSKGKATLFVWTNLADSINSDIEAGETLNAIPWGMFKGNARHTGVFGED